MELVIMYPIAFVVLSVMLLKMSYVKYNINRPVVGCLRTRNSGQYLEEYLKHHFRIGFTEIHLYDDSDVSRHDTKKIVPTRIEHSQQYIYHDRRGWDMDKETDYLKECFDVALEKYNNGIIVSLDDDEFIEILELSVKDVKELMKQGSITDAKTLVALQYYFLGEFNE